ncbi:MAG TPA: hypothetical protein VGI45_31810 [Terracidiphilus sp.]|jgi:uncharacterized membrane protein YkoI
MRFPSALLVVCSIAFSLTPLGYSAEKKISHSDLPLAVQKTAQEHSKGATVKSYSRDTENGQLEYEVEMTVDGHSKDVSIAPDGRVLEIEEQVQLNALPAKVQQALETKAEKGEITKVESIVKNGRLVAYEAQVSANGRHKEIQVGPEGNALSHEE